MITFLDFLKESVDDDDGEKYRAERRAKAKVQDESMYPEFSWAVAEERYRVGDVFFDNIEGLGATPNNRNIHYKGIVGMMTPARFLSVVAGAHSSDVKERGEKFVPMVQERIAMAAPTLYINVDKVFNPPDVTKDPLYDLMKDSKYWLEDKSDASAFVSGHEGRGRVTAIARVFGNSIQLPVHLFFSCGNFSQLTPEEKSTVINGLKQIKSEVGLGPYEDRFTQLIYG